MTFGTADKSSRSARIGLTEFLGIITVLLLKSLLFCFFQGFCPGSQFCVQLHSEFPCFAKARLRQERERLVPSPFKFLFGAIFFGRSQEQIEPCFWWNLSRLRLQLQPQCFHFF